MTDKLSMPPPPVLTPWKFIGTLIFLAFVWVFFFGVPKGIIQGMERAAGPTINLQVTHFGPILLSISNEGPEPVIRVLSIGVNDDERCQVKHQKLARKMGNDMPSSFPEPLQIGETLLVGSPNCDITDVEIHSDAGNGRYTLTTPAMRMSIIENPYHR